MSVWPLFLPRSSFHLLLALSPAAQRCPLLPRFPSAAIPSSTGDFHWGWGGGEKDARVEAAADCRTDVAPGGRR